MILERYKAQNICNKGTEHYASLCRVYLKHGNRPRHYVKVLENGTRTPNETLCKSNVGTNLSKCG